MVAELVRQSHGRHAGAFSKGAIKMLSKTSTPSGSPAANRPVTTPIWLTPKQTARHLNLSVSWLAKRRLAGDGPPYIKLGGAVRYAEASLQQWMKGQQRTSTSG